MNNERTRVGVLSTLWNIIGKETYEDVEDIPELDADRLAAKVMNRINHKPANKRNNPDVEGTQPINKKISEKNKNIERERD